MWTWLPCLALRHYIRIYTHIKYRSHQPVTNYHRLNETLAKAKLNEEIRKKESLEEERKAEAEIARRKMEAEARIAEAAKIAQSTIKASHVAQHSSHNRLQWT